MTITEKFLKLPSNKKLLVIVGPTASGKTKLALKLAKKYDGELISVDSRQIYKYMDIGTGKDIENSEFRIQNSELKRKIERLLNIKINLGYYELDSSRLCSNNILRERPRAESRSLIKIWGLDLIEPNQEFSVAQWVEWAKTIINDIWLRNKLVIIVGGTGFWIRALLKGIEWGRVPRNLEFRIQNSELTIKQLQEKLRQYDKKFGQNLSASDWLNKRRLIRRIEIAEYLKKHPQAKVAIEGIDKSIRVETIILRSKIYDLRSKICERIEKRLKQGLLREIKQLLARGYSFKDPGMNSLGYKEFKEYFKWTNCHLEEVLAKNKRDPSVSPQDDITAPQDDITGKQLLNQAIEQWQKDENDYARRQMVWIKKIYDL